jgi:ATP-binding cassette subfamily F protein 3
LTRIANKIWHIENYQLKEYPGTYQEFDIFQEQRKQQAKADLKASQNKNAAPKLEQKKAVEPIDKSKQTEQKKEKQKLEQQVKKLEEHLNKLKLQHDNLSEKMSDPEIFKDAVAFKKLQVAYSSSEKDVKKAEMEWEAAYEKLLAFD